MNFSEINSNSDTNSYFRGPKLPNLSDQILQLNQNFSYVGKAENNSANQTENLELSLKKSQENLNTSLKNPIFQKSPYFLYKKGSIFPFIRRFFS